MNSARDLSREQLVQLVDHVQQALYLDADARGMIWNPDKAWDAETTESIAEAMIDVGLKPQQKMRREAPTGLLSVVPDVMIAAAGAEVLLAQETRLLSYKLNIDFARLRQQKSALLALIGLDSPLMGLVELLDAIQDQAVDIHGLPEKQVFGPAIEE
jgi:hypothetical protein